MKRVAELKQALQEACQCQDDHKARIIAFKLKNVKREQGKTRRNQKQRRDSRI